MGFQQDCQQCHDPQKRKPGCDEAAAEPIDHIEPCPFCRGDRDDCDHCHGTNKVPFYRCPYKLATRRELDCVMACVQIEHGLLPDPGGWQDQAATFTAAWPYVMNEVSRWREIAREQAMRDSERNAKSRR